MPCYDGLSALYREETERRLHKLTAMMCRLCGRLETADAMTKEELWSIYAQRNPSFNGTEPVTLTPAGLKKLFDQTWAQAYEAGTEDAESRQMDPGYSTRHANELYEKIFGRKKPF